MDRPLGALPQPAVLVRFCSLESLASCTGAVVWHGCWHNCWADTQHHHCQRLNRARPSSKPGILNASLPSCGSLRS